MRRLVFITLIMAAKAEANILEERVVTGSSQLVPTPFILNPAQNPTQLTLFGVEQSKRDDDVRFVLNPGQNEAEVKEKVSHKDLIIGGQYPLGGASLGLQYSEQRRTVNARHINRNRDNNELFVARDYRVNFAVDFTPMLRGAFTFHNTAMQADLQGNFFIGEDDRTRYKGSLSGYGLGLNYQAGLLDIGAFSHAPMRGKAMIEGEQKIVTEPGVYGLSLNFRAGAPLNLAFNVHRWSYKRDERDDEATSPVAQQGISLRGLDLNQFLRKTMAYGFAAEFAVNPLVFAKAGIMRQEAVFLFDGDRVPGDDKNQETKLRYSELRAGVAIKNRAFIAEFGLLTNTAAEKNAFRDGSRFGGVGQYTAKGTGAFLMAGGAF